MIPRNSIGSAVFAAALCVTAQALAQDSPFGPPEPIDLREGYTLERVVLSEREIPVLFLTRDDVETGPKPVVFLIHGGGMPDINGGDKPWAKEGWFDPKYHGVPYMLADGGLVVALIDLWWAGERYKPEYREIVRRNYFASLILGFVETTRDLSLLIDAFESMPEIDATRVGSTGRSGGGNVSLMAAAHEPRITAVTSWVGACGYLEWALDKMPERTRDHFVKRDPSIATMLNDFDPINNVEKFPPAAVLLINNRNDPFVSFAAADKLYEKLLPLYAEFPERLQRHVLDPEEPTHAMTKEDYTAGCAWLIKHLNE